MDLLSEQVEAENAYLEPSKTLFTPNYLHDVESVLWMALFSQTSTLPMEIDGEFTSPPVPDPFSVHAHSIIFNDSSASKRQSLLLRKNAWLKLQHTLPKQYSKTLIWLGGFRQLLQEQYKRVEEDIAASELRGMGSFYTKVIKCLLSSADVACSSVTSIDRTMRIVTGHESGSGSVKRKLDRPERKKLPKRTKLSSPPPESDMQSETESESDSGSDYQP